MSHNQYNFLHFSDSDDMKCLQGGLAYSVGQKFIDYQGRQCMCTPTYEVICDSKDCEFVINR